jgi:hypothetical protein
MYANVCITHIKHLCVFLCNIRMKQEVDGIVMIVSCQKHMHTRLKEFKLSRDQYDRWKVVYIIGDLFLDKEYEMRDGNYLWIKCEDSYLHIIKKVALAIKYLYQLYDIKEGILRCGDDLVFNDSNLLTFLRSKKYDYYGQSIYIKNNCSYLGELRHTRTDEFMHNYYKEHSEDFDNPQHNIKSIDMSKYIVRPVVYGASGVLYYISNIACKTLVNHMEEIGYNILHYDELTKSYPYTIEDCGVSFIMYLKNIHFTNSFIFYSDNDYNAYVLCTHTNKFK